MADPVKDRFFVTLGRLLRLAGCEYDSVKGEYGNNWNSLSEKQRFDILDKHVLEISADVIHDLPTFLQELKISLDQFNNSKDPKNGSVCCDSTKKKTSDQAVKKVKLPESEPKKKIPECCSKKPQIQKKATNESTTKKKSCDTSTKDAISVTCKKCSTEIPLKEFEAKKTSNETSPQKETTVQSELVNTTETSPKVSSQAAENDKEARISLQVNIHRLKNLMPAQLKILLRSMDDDQLPDLDILEAIIDDSEKTQEEDKNKIEDVIENNTPDEGLDPELEELFAAVCGDVNNASTPAATQTGAVFSAVTADAATGEDEDLEEVFRANADKTPYFPTQPYFGRTFVVDNGSETIRAGFGDEQCPRVSIVNAVEIFDQEAGEGNKRSKKFQYNMENGVVKDWDDMQKMWTHIFKSLYINPTEHPVLMSDVAINPQENRKRITEIMFEEYHVPAFCIQNQSVLSMYGAGTSTGISVNIGESLATVLPVYEYNPISHALQTSNIAGNYLNRQLTRAMKRHYLDDRHIIAQPELAREIKERHCYIASDFFEEVRESTKSPGIQKAVCNPGLEVFLSDEVFTVPEAIFNPKVTGEENCPGICEMIRNCLRDSDVQLRPELRDNVVLSGGTTLIPGFLERMRKELRGIDPSLNIVAPNDRRELVWRGGTVLSTLPSFQNGLVTAQDYMEYGADIVHKKCAC